MKQGINPLWAVLAIMGGTVALTANWAGAQDDGAEPEAAAEASAAEGDDGGEGEEGSEAAAPIVPGINKDMKIRPADVLPLASRGLLLDVVNTGKRYIAVGTRGSILLSVTGKPSEWAQVQSPVRAALTAVSFADENNGWVVGHDATIARTNDGGETWILQNYQPELEKPFLDVIAIDSSTAIAIGAYGLLFSTKDGGSTWATVDAPEIRGDELHFNGITKLANGNLLLAGEQGMLGLSTDGGATWQKLKSPYEGSYFGALPSGDAGAMIFGLRGNIYVTQDAAAAEWKKVETASVVSLFGGTRLPDGRAALGGINGTILLVDAGGGVREQRVAIREKDKVGIERERILASTFSSVVPLGDSGLLIVGEEGVRTTALVQ